MLKVLFFSLPPQVRAEGNVGYLLRGCCKVEIHGEKSLQRRVGPFCAGWSCVWWASWTIMQPTLFLVTLRIRGCWAPMMCHPHHISPEDAPGPCNALQASQDRTHPLFLSHTSTSHTGLSSGTPVAKDPGPGFPSSHIPIHWKHAWGAYNPSEVLAPNIHCANLF